MLRVAEIKDILQWYVESGVDETAGNSPLSRFAASAPTRAAKSKKKTEKKTSLNRRSSPPLLQSRDAAVETAQEVAKQASTLDELHHAFKAFDGCPLKETAINFVFADGPSSARLMFIGEAPGGEEDRQGIPFVGPAGQLLEKMLAAISIARPDVYITNLLPWRPPGNRTPTNTEIAACLPFLKRHIDLVKPDILILIGGTAAKTLLCREEGVMKLRGKWMTYERDNGDQIPARAMLHPAFLLRQPAQKRETWQDLMEVRVRLDAIS